MRNSFSQFSQGRLISWQNNKGFGFIKPDNGGKDIFLHTDQMKRMKRRPQIGDVIFYKLSYKPNGMTSIVILVEILFWKMNFGRSRNSPLIMSIFKPGCNVKGNISFNAGNKIYHLPGMEDYASTVINSSSGE
jgi:cold shock CspA family protein